MKTKPEQDYVMRYYLYNLGIAIREKNDEMINKILKEFIEDNDIIKEQISYINSFIAGYDGTCISKKCQG